MSYNPSIPQAGDNPSQSQSQLLDNFTQLNNFLSENHVALNASGQGKHSFLQMPEQAAAPSTLVDEVAFYSKLSTNKTAGNQAELFYRQEDSGGAGGAEYQLTNAFNGGVSDGSYIIPGGLKVRWGRRDLVSNGTTISLAPDGFTSSIYNIQITILRAGDANLYMYVRDGTLTLNSFVVNTNGSSIGMFFLAIGV